MKKKALIIGITGQDGINLSKLLLKKKYKILGATRNLFNARKKLKKLREFKKIQLIEENFYSLKSSEKFLLKFKPNYIFFLAGQ